MTDTKCCEPCGGSGRQFVDEGWPYAICTECNGLGRVPDPEKEAHKARGANATFGAYVVESVSRELTRLGELLDNWKKTTDEGFDAKDARIAQLEAELADWELIKNEPVVQGRLAVIKLVARRKEQP